MYLSESLDAISQIPFSIAPRLKAFLKYPLDGRASFARARSGQDNAPNHLCAFWLERAFCFGRSAKGYS